MSQKRARGLEQVLREAARDQGFLEELVADREAAVGRLGIELTDSEWSALRAMASDELRHAVERLVRPDDHRRESPPQVVCAPAHGMRGDVPPAREGLLSRLWRKLG